MTDLAALFPALLCCACLDTPELDDLVAPLADLGGVESWGPIESPPIPNDDDDETGPAADDGPGTGSEHDSGDEAGGVAPHPALAQLRLTEVLSDPDGKDGGEGSPEFVEVHNPGPSPVALDGLIIEAASWPMLDADELGLVGVTLEPGAFLLVRRWTSGVAPDLTALEVNESLVAVGFEHGSGLRNDDGLVRIGSTGSGMESIDEFVYGLDLAEPSAGWSGPPTTSPEPGRSMCRSSPIDHDDASDWSPCDPNPGQATPEDVVDHPRKPSTINPGDVQIVEVLANPPGPGAGEKAYEYVEILNASDVEIELSGCRIGDDPEPDALGIDPLEYLAGDGGCGSTTCLAPGQRALIVGQGYAGPIGDGLVLATDDTTIADAGLTNSEPVVLWDALGNALSTYRAWPDPSVDPLPLDEQPLHRLDVAAPDEPPSWVSAPPSPGE
jgi:Lamin Tail Domain